MNDIKASLAFGIALVVLGAWLIRWHFVAWRTQSREKTADDREIRHYRLQFRRRIQVSALVILVGVMLPLGDWLMVQRKNPGWIAVFWIAVLILALWMMLLAIFDWLSTRMHVRATRAALAGIARKQRELEAEADRLRNRRSNGKH
jgi:hypothetical protein